MRALLLVVGSTLGMFVAGSAAAQDVVADPPVTKAPTEPPAAEPPPPASPPPEAPPASPPPEAPSAPPPPAPPPPHSEPAPARVTLEETPPDDAPSTKPGAPGARPQPKRKARRTHHPKAEAAPPQPAPVSSPASTGEPAPKPAPVEATPAGDESEPRSKDDDEGEGLLGPFRIGGLVGIGLPSLLSFGGMIKLTRYVGAGLNVGLIPAIKLSLYGDAELSYQEYDIYGRLFPFGGSLFVGAGVGYASIKGSFSTKQDLSSVPNLPPNVPNPLFIASVGSVRTLVLTPTIGLLHTFGSGFTFGVDIGVQLPIAPSTTRFTTILPASIPPQVNDDYVKPNDKKVQDTLDTVGRTILPTLNLRVGWLI